MHTIKDKFYIIDRPLKNCDVTQATLPNLLVYTTLEILDERAAQNNVDIQLGLVGSSTNGKPLAEFKTHFSIGEINFESGPKSTDPNSKSNDCDTIIQFQGREPDINRFITDTLIRDQSQNDYRYRGYGGLLSSALSELHYSLPLETKDFSDGSTNHHIYDGIAGFYNIPWIEANLQSQKRSGYLFNAATQPHIGWDFLGFSVGMRLRINEQNKWFPWFQANCTINRDGIYSLENNLDGNLNQPHLWPHQRNFLHLNRDRDGYFVHPSEQKCQPLPYFSDPPIPTDNPNLLASILKPWMSGEVVISNKKQEQEFVKQLQEITRGWRQEEARVKNLSRKQRSHAMNMIRTGQRLTLIKNLYTYTQAAYGINDDSSATETQNFLDEISHKFQRIGIGKYLYFLQQNHFGSFGVDLDGHPTRRQILRYIGPRKHKNPKNKGRFSYEPSESHYQYHAGSTLADLPHNIDQALQMEIHFALNSLTPFSIGSGICKIIQPNTASLLLHARTTNPDNNNIFRFNPNGDRILLTQI